MKYQKKKFWKYRVFADCSFRLKISYPLVEHKFFKIYGKMIWVKKGYTFDGATGIPDTEKTLIMAVVHDPFYQAMREGLLDVKYKDAVDQEAERMYKERSSWLTSWMGNFIYWGVKYLGKSSIKSDVIEVF